jgi:cytochrome P450
MDAIDRADLDFDWSAPGALGADYIPRLLKIQEFDPIFWSNCQSAWVVTRHADILAGLRDSRLSNQRYHLELEARSETGGGATLGTVRRWVFNQDGSEHMRLRTLLIKPFSKSQADTYRSDIRGIMNARIDRLANRDSFDFFKEFAAPFVAEALLHIIGFTGVITPERMIEMADAIVAALVTAGDQASVSRADRAIEELTPLIEAEIDDRRHTARNDLLTALVHLSEDGERLTREDIVSLFHVLMLAAIDTTAHTLSLIVPVLDERADSRTYLREHPHRMPAIVEELQRYIGMQNMMHRIASEDFEWHGRQIHKGDMVFFMLAAGNFDPGVFDRADELDFERERKQQLTFAPGLHSCIGMHIAKMEIEEALKTIFTRFGRVRVLQPPQYQANYMTRSFHSLNVRFEV